MCSRHLINRNLLQQRRKRAIKRKNVEDSSFLQAHCAREMVERLSFINRQWHRIIDIGGLSNHFARLMSHIQPDSEFFRLDDMAANGGVAVIECEQLPLREQCTDLILSNLHLQWSNNLTANLKQLHTSLKPDGLLLGSLIGEGSLHELRQCLMQAETEILGGIYPHIHPFPSLGNVGQAIQQVGFKLPVLDEMSLSLTYPHFEKLIDDLRAMGATSCLNLPENHSISRPVLKRTREIYHQKYANDEGKLLASFQLIYILAWRYHENQPQPLKPGSADIRLSDALKNMP